MKNVKSLVYVVALAALDPNAAAPPPETLRARAAIGSSRFIGLAEKVLPILTPDQRKIAAEKLRAMANAGVDVPFGH